MSFSKTFSITFGDVAENHKGMQKVGNLSDCGFNLNDLNRIKDWFESKGSKCNIVNLHWLLEEEDRMGFSTIKPYHAFQDRVFKHRDKLKQLISLLIEDGKRILGYGASTKGNVLLQLCNFTAAEIPAIAEVNEEKFGRLTPGTHIPIISDKEARAMKPDYFLVLPWHFKEGILQREQEYLARGGKFIFPFPFIEII
jgi:hypothetical protein